MEEENRIVRLKLKAAAMRPIPHTRPRCPRFLEPQKLANLMVKRTEPAPVKHITTSCSFGKPQDSFNFIPACSANYFVKYPLPSKKHGCDRASIVSCSEDELLRDVMQFSLSFEVIFIPQGGLAEFPDAVLNAKRLDLYNLYIERGCFERRISCWEWH